MESVEIRSEMISRLLDHYSWLATLLTNPDAGNLKNYLPAAGQLRVLLCDGELPLLLKFAEMESVPLLISSQLPQYEPPAELPDMPKPIFGLEAKAIQPHWCYYLDDNTMPIAEYLESAVGIATVEGTGSEYTPKQIIKWAANKEGIAHFDPRKPATYRFVKNITMDAFSRKQSIVVETIIYSLARWAMAAILFTLSKHFLDRSRESYLSKSASKRQKLPKGISLLAQYKLLDKSMASSFFEGSHCLTVESFTGDLSQGFSFFALMWLPGMQVNSGNVYLFDSICSGEIQRISITVVESSTICLEVYSSKEEPLLIKVDVREWTDNQLYFVLNCNIGRMVCSRRRISMYINDEIEPRASTQIPMESEETKIKNFVIAGNASCGENSTFFSTEILLLDEECGSKDRDEIAKYLWQSLQKF